jgi:glucosamine-6-phosphate deaminase
MTDWKYDPSPFVPFRDKTTLEKCRKIKRADIDKHPNKDLKITVIKDCDAEFIWVTDMFKRIKASDDENRKTVLILPNPAPSYRHVARLINACRINCRNLYGFAMDEYADQDGNIAPADWKQGFTWSMMNYLWKEIDEDLRPPQKNFVGFTNQNIKDYGKLIEDAGNADACYSGPGWTGHLAFIEPDAPEFDGTLDEWKKMGPRICTLSPYTLAQNSLHGSFGMSGDIARVPPKAATIGPKEVIQSKYRMDMHALTVHGSKTSWQRLMTRLVLHGPVTPKLPTSIHQLLKSDVIISETAAADIVDDFDKGY